MSYREYDGRGDLAGYLGGILGRSWGDLGGILGGSWGGFWGDLGGILGGSVGGRMKDLGFCIETVSWALLQCCCSLSVSLALHLFVKKYIHVMYVYQTRAH